MKMKTLTIIIDDIQIVLTQLKSIFCKTRTQRIQANQLKYEFCSYDIAPSYFLLR